MCMSPGCTGSKTKSNSYTPKKATAAKSGSRSSAPKAWAGTSSAYGQPKVRISFGKR